MTTISQPIELACANGSPRPLRKQAGAAGWSSRSSSRPLGQAGLSEDQRVIQRVASEATPDTAAVSRLLYPPGRRFTTARRQSDVAAIFGRSDVSSSFDQKGPS